MRYILLWFLCCEITFAGGTAPPVPTSASAAGAGTVAPEPASTRVRSAGREGSTLKIMPLGDSITELDWEGGFRSFLYKMLIDEGVDFDYVGTKNVNHEDANLGFVFPQAFWDHEGYGAATIDSSTGYTWVWNQHVDAKLAANPPDLILLLLGTNDLNQGCCLGPDVVNQMSDFLEQIWTFDPEIAVILGTPPSVDPHSRAVLNERIADFAGLLPALVSEKQGLGRKIVLADHHAVMNTTSDIQPDGVHPTVQGYRKMAQVWHDAFHALGLYSITATAGPHGSVTPPGVSRVPYDDFIVYGIVPDSGYHIDSVVVDGINIGNAPDYAFTGVRSDHTISAWFSTTQYTIAASASAGGSIEPEGAVMVDSGADTSFTIIPDPGYGIAGVLVDSVPAGPVPSYAFNDVRSNHTISATFAPLTFTITAVAGPHGTVSPAGATVVGYGDSLEILFVPDSAYYVAGVLVDSVFAGALSGYTFTDITADHTVQVFFATDTPPAYTVPVSPAKGADIEPGVLRSMTFTWASSSDPDLGDTVTYGIAIAGPGCDFTEEGLTDTMVTLDLSSILSAGHQYSWTVEVSAGGVTVWSPDTFNFVVDLGTGLEDGPDAAPAVFGLMQNYPNPFNPVTILSYTVPRQSRVTLRVFNVLGEEVSVPVDEVQPPGQKEVSWDGNQLPAGVYFYRVTAGENAATRKMLLMK